MAMEINGLNNNQGNTSKAKSGGSVVAPKNSNQETASGDSSSAKETVRISAEGQTLSRVSSELGSDTPVNREKVEVLKAAIADGSYKANPQEIAKKMLKEDTLF